MVPGEGEGRRFLWPSGGFLVVACVSEVAFTSEEDSCVCVGGCVSGVACASEVALAAHNLRMVSS